MKTSINEDGESTFVTFPRVVSYFCFEGDGFSFVPLLPIMFL